ncbi:MAG TPA: BON domain-containing protein [Verrucomicrobiae bacterium]|nr:BON domain-containing protein [Verrucomicrobiae bacterium]
MKIPTQIAIVASLSLVAGCAQSHRTRYSENISSGPSYESTAIASSPGGGVASPSSVYSSQTEPGGTTASDAEIVSQVRETLRQDPVLAEIVPGLQISAANGVVTLSGNIADAQQKQTIDAVVQEIAGVTTVKDELQVSGQTASTGMGTSAETGNLSATSRTDENSSSLYSGNSTNSMENSSAAELNPTSRTNSESQIYSNSTNDMSGANQELNPTSRTNSESQIYSNSTNDMNGAGQELNPTSRTNSESQIYLNSTNDMNGANQELNPTSRTNSESQIYSNSTNDMNSAGQELNPTSRTNSESQIYSEPDSMNSNTSSNQDNSLSPTSNNQSQRNYQSGAMGSESGVTVMVQGSSAGDQTLAQQITQDLRSDSSLSSALSQVRISLENGKVTLQGSVPNEQKKKDIESAVQKISGVSSVDNQLQVGSSQPSPMNQ